MNPATSPAAVPTTRFPSCIGNQRTGYSAFGRPLTAWKTRHSVGWMVGHRAPTTEGPAMTSPIAETISHSGCMDHRAIERCLL